MSIWYGPWAVLVVIATSTTAVAQGFIDESWNRILYSSQPEKSDYPQAIESTELSRFIGRLEGILLCEIPPRFLESFTAARAIRGDLVVFKQPDDQVSNDFNIGSVDSEIIEISDGKKSYDLPASSLNIDRLIAPSVASLVVRDSIFVSIYDSQQIGKPQVISIASPGGELNWQYHADDNVACSAVGFGSYQSLELILSKDNAIVMFGIGYHDFFVAKVEFESGKELEYFSTCLHSKKTTD